MAEAWPPTLPSYFSTQNFSRRPTPNTIRTRLRTAGRIKARAISKGVQEPTLASFLMTNTQFSIFENFWTLTLEDGVLPFQDLNDPYTQTNTVWQAAEDYQATAEGGNLVRVNLPLLKLPDAPT